ATITIPHESRFGFHGDPPNGGRITMAIVTDRQVRCLRTLLKSGKPLKVAAMRVDMDRKTARKYRDLAMAVSGSSVSGSDFVFGFSSASRNQDQSLTPRAYSPWPTG